MSDDLRAIKNVSECWGWINANDKTLQDETFTSLTEAYAEMCRRLSLNFRDYGSMDQIYMLGFKLATMQKTLTIKRILD